MTTAIKANRLIMNRRNELVYDRGNAWCPLGDYSTMELAEVLEEHGDDEIQVSFVTCNEKTAERDKKTYSRRLNTLQPYWLFSGWQNKVVDGHILTNTFVGTLCKGF